MGYVGVPPQSGFITTAKQRVTSSTNNYVDLDNSISSLADVIVWVNSVKQDSTNLSLTTSTRITLGGTLTASDVVEIAYLGKAVATQTPDTGTVTNDMLAGSIANSKLANSSITLNGSAVSLGSSASVGKIGQCVSTLVTSTTSINADTFADISGMTLSITPSASSSKVLILVQLYVSGGATANQPINLLRDSTVLGRADSDGYTFAFRQAQDGQSIYRMHNLSHTILDTPSSSSALTYKLQWKTNSGPLYLNRPNDTGGLGANVTTGSTITALEVLA
jgi:hypothetical protein